MRFIVPALFLSLLAGCTAGPQALGITGPQGAPAKAANVPGAMNGPTDPLDNSDTMGSGGRYGPNFTPTTNGGRFWGYN